MQVRTFQKGDEAVQAGIYNEAAGNLPKFKRATEQEVTRRAAAAEFDPSTRFYAIEGGRPVAYVVFNANGRVSYPWCRNGREELAVPLFEHALEQMRKRGMQKTFVAYRGDWSEVLDFFRRQGFSDAREMVSFLIDPADAPTASVIPANTITPLRREDVSALFAIAPHALRSTNASEFERHLFENPYFPSSDVFVLRNKQDGTPKGAGILVRNSAYADPSVLDANMPCFRLGAFGTEGMQTKRINGLFSFLCRDDAQCGAIATEILGHATSLLQPTDNISMFGCQVPSDAPLWLRFYQSTGRRQGSFPVLEKVLVSKN